MKNLLLNDEETVMAYLAVKMFHEDAKDHAPGLNKLLNAMSSKIEQHLKDNPMMIDGMIKIMESDPMFADLAHGKPVLEMLKHISAAQRIMEDIKGETEDCSLCDGAGKFISGSGLPCPRCGGSGKLNKKETYN